jgi:hypothetical protein
MVGFYPVRLTVQRITSTARSMQLTVNQADRDPSLSRFASRLWLDPTAGPSVGLGHILHPELVALGEQRLTPEGEDHLVRQQDPDGAGETQNEGDQRQDRPQVERRMP